MFKPKQKKSSLAFGQNRSNWFRRHKKLTIIFSVVAIVLIGGGVTTAIYIAHQKPAKDTSEKVITKPTPTPDAPKFYSAMTGNLVADEPTTKQTVTAIMIENSPDARPQSGLKNSGVVFEAIAEGGITRFLALYQQEKPTLVGPVRSVRMYYVDWLAAFNASVAHVGGSAAALAEVRSGGYRDIDQFFNSGSYYRASDRYAPHNVYTSFERLDALNNAKGYTSSTFVGFARKDSVAAATPTATSISMTVSSALYNPSYMYNATTNTYDRSEAGVPHLDRESGQISPRVVIALSVTETTIFEDGYRESINAIGTGKATIFQDGTVQEVTWTKANKTDQIVFTDATGAVVPLARGQTWITATPQTGGVSWR